MKVKHIIALFIVGLLCTILGALFKILHWQLAPELLIAGTVIKVLAGIFAIWKILTTDGFKKFLNM